MRILMINDSLRRGGRERRMIELLKGLTEQSDLAIELAFFDVEIAYPEINELGIPIHILERKPKKDPTVFYRFYKLCKRFTPDIIHSWGTMASIYAIPASKILGIKLINGNITDAPAGLNIFDSRYFRAKLTFPFSDIVLGNSFAGLEAYRAPRSKSRCIHNGFDFKRIKNLEDPESVRSRLGIKPGKVVGMVGAFHQRKDYKTFIQAATLLLESGQEVNFIAIGDGPEWSRCKASIKSIFPDRILLTGQMDQIESVVNIFDIGVLATNSAVHGEGISNSIVEYMAFGKPVVATTGGGTPEVVKDGETGLLVPPASPKALAKKIQYLLDHPETAKSMGEKGKDRVNQEFSLERMTYEFLKLYQIVLGNNKISTSSKKCDMEKSDLEMAENFNEADHINK